MHEEAAKGIDFKPIPKWKAGSYSAPHSAMSHVVPGSNKLELKQAEPLPRTTVVTGSDHFEVSRYV
jgi:hypothetical protein